MKRIKITWKKLAMIFIGVILAVFCPNLMMAIATIWFILNLFNVRNTINSMPEDRDS